MKDKRVFDKKVQDFIMYKLLIVYALIAFGIATTIWLGNAVFLYPNQVLDGIFYFSIISILGMIGFGVKAYLDIKAKKDMSMKYFTSINMFSIFTVMSACAGIIEFGGILHYAPTYLTWFLVGVGVLYFIMVSYKRDTFTLFFMTITDLALVFVACQNIDNPLSIVVVATSVLFLLATMLVTNNARKNGGKILGFEVFDAKAKYTIINFNVLGLISVTAACVILAILGENLAFAIGGIYFTLLSIFVVAKNI